MSNGIPVLHLTLKLGVALVTNKGPALFDITLIIAIILGTAL